MLDIILDFLTHAAMFALIAAAIGGTVLFFLAATWMQVQDGKEQAHEQETGAQAGGIAAPAAQRRRRGAACGYTRTLP